jgi:hypothetical protein
MAYCMIIENPDEEQEQFERMTAHLRGSGPFPPEGQRLIIAGPGDPGWRLVSVWDSPAAFERFAAERLLPATRATGCPLDNVKRTMFEVHTLIAGDLVGAAHAPAV